MADYAAEIEVWSDRKTKREEIRNYDVVQDYLANDTYPKERQKQWNVFQENGEEVQLVDGVVHYKEPFPQAGPRYQIYFSFMKIELFCTLSDPET